MLGEILLGAWTCAGLAWWIIALRLVVAERNKPHPAPQNERARESLTVFKPLPPLGAQGLRHVGPGIESFVAQLDEDAELLLGIHESDRDFTGPFLKRLLDQYPTARLKIIFRDEHDSVANPKIAWLRFLAPHASGDFWLWSDADILAPPGFLQTSRRDLASCNVAMVTYPYTCHSAESPSALLETLFVNADFYPGVLLLRRRGTVDFGLGAAMIFRCADFEHKVDWTELGTWLADDFQLGQRLGPVRIGELTLSTVPTASAWPAALMHDIRWSRTIRWNRPGGFFARLAVLPIFGWVTAVAICPGHIFAWVGLAGMVQADVLAAFALCRATGFALSWRNIANLEWWSFWRAALWAAGWLPVPVVWGSTKWRGPQLGNST
jgi:hypothetical protein